MEGANSKVVSATDVFQKGKYDVTSITLWPTINISRPPSEIFIVSPATPGTYSVLLFLSGFLINNHSYSQLLKHISSHGYIVIAPLLYHNMFISGPDEIDRAAKVINWLPKGLRFGELPTGVNADVQSLALAGHSRGGKAAFALALGRTDTKITIKPSVLIGLDPVAGSTITGLTEPHILTSVPHSFDLDIPVTVIGTGLGCDEKKVLIFSLPPCAPKGMDHVDFFQDSKPPCTHIVAKDYGHMDMLDDGANVLESCMCASGTGDKDSFRRCLGGIFVAVLRASLEGKSDDLNAIVNKTVVPPVTLDPITYIEDCLNIKARL